MTVIVPEFFMILRPPGYPGVEVGDVGRLAGDSYLARDGVWNIDVYSTYERHFVNLTFPVDDVEVVGHSRDLMDKGWQSGNPRAAECYRMLSGTAYQKWTEKYR